MNTSAPSILYVDDESDNLMAFRALFRRFYSVKTASNGQAALELLDQETFDILLSDQRMPGMTGVELCRAVHQRFPAIRRYIVTGYSETALLEEALADGTILSVFAKPIDFQKLQQALH